MRKRNTNLSRRDVLGSLGAIGATGLAGTGAASAMSEADDVRRFGDVRTETRYERTVQIEASGVARYRVGVTGLLTAEDGPQSALADGVAR